MLETRYQLRYLSLCFRKTIKNLIRADCHMVSYAKHNLFNDGLFSSGRVVLTLLGLLYELHTTQKTSKHNGMRNTILAGLTNLSLKYRSKRYFLLR